MSRSSDATSCSMSSGDSFERLGELGCPLVLSCPLREGATGERARQMVIQVHVELTGGAHRGEGYPARRGAKLG